MPFRLIRVFCSTPAGLEPERQAFHRALNTVNEAEGTLKGILFVPVSILPNMTNKLIFQSAIDRNIRECTFFVQVGTDVAGEHTLAEECIADPTLPMLDIAVFEKEDFERKAGAQLSAWLMRL